MRQPRMRRLVATMAAAAAAAGLAAGCSSKDQVPSIGYAVDVAITSYNAGSARGAAGGAAAVFGRVLPGFFYTGPDGQQVADTDVGTAKEVPGEAQTIQYRLNPDGVYSDGVPTSCDDLVFTWAARSGRFTEPGPDGMAPMFDTASTAGYEDIERVECQSGSKDATVVFRPGHRYLNWRTLFAAGELMPAHIAAQAADVPDVVSAVQSGALAAVKRLAGFWNTGWTLAPGELDLSLLPSSGPYRIDSYTAEDGLVLVANERWWGNKPETGRIVVWPKTTDLAAKIREGAVGVIDIGAGSIADLNLDGYGVRQVPSRGVEQLVLGTGGVFGSVQTRRAFALCVPRQELFDQLGKVDEAPEHGLGSGPANARIVQQDSLFYPAVAGTADRYRTPNAINASAALDAEGVPDATVRIGYLGPDTRRAETVAMIADSCKSAGITVVDAGSPDFTPARLTEGKVDAVLGSTAGAPGPAGSLSGVAATSALRTGSGLNFGRFGNGRYDAITDQLAADDNSVAVLNLLTEAENLLWSQMPSIPLFATPRTIAFGAGLQNGIAGPTKAGTGWNMDRWVLTR
ncbi:ABC transporter substrate-binding protein [Nocardia donostiensis]|uniref:Peptide-binding protein n=1 Tax=Nocardia donostiensis TaxID=1538463 RepID=A0A1W0ATT6_9NOCA|nr:ABC transporter substrate-binding protein [Nocardia donostiensis]ONM47698.1 peptide-binding protein [Nocardia donostiensis]OQS13629.1 peptide-binding protein [Nocardia donostiensis]OQS22450.1 peptide-binding protein [Nocardia donostiensis]